MINTLSVHLCHSTYQLTVEAMQNFSHPKLSRKVQKSNHREIILLHIGSTNVLAFSLSYALSFLVVNSKLGHIH